MLLKQKYAGLLFGMGGVNDVIGVVCDFLVIYLYQAKQTL